MVSKIVRVFLVLAVPVLLACGGGGGGSTPTSTNSSTNSSMMTVQIGDDFFSPKDIQVQPGTTVHWVMAGVHPGHTVTDTGGAFNSGMIFTSSGASFDHVFTSADSGKTFNYFCQTHVNLGMKGSVQVGQGAAPPNPGY
jgi:plastocyanin